VSTLGKELGISTPYNDVIGHSVKAREATFQAD
jgi:ketopantoate reductase